MDWNKKEEGYQTDISDDTFITDHNLSQYDTKRRKNKKLTKSKRGKSEAFGALKDHIEEIMSSSSEDENVFGVEAGLCIPNIRKLPHARTRREWPQHTQRSRG